MSGEWVAHVQDDWQHMGLAIVWGRDFPGGREMTDGTTVWTQTGDEGVLSLVEPLRLREDMGRALLAALLRHYNGADDARMLRKDYDAERKRVDLLLEKVSNPIIVVGGDVTRTAP